MYLLRDLGRCARGIELGPAAAARLPQYEVVSRVARPNRGLGQRVRLVIGAGPTAETREETVFEEGGDNATLPSWVGTSSKAKALGSGKSVHRWARKSHLAKLAKFEH